MLDCFELFPWCPMLENVTSNSRYNVAQDEQYGVNTEDHEVNDDMEEDDNNNIVEYGGTNRLIQDTFTQMYDDKFHDIHDITLLD